MRRRNRLLFTLIIFLTAGAHAAERKKLGDLPDEPKKKDETLIEEPAAPTASPTEKPLEDDVAEEFYQKGIKALNEGKLDQAEAFFDRVLVIKPNHVGAQEGVAYIMQTLEDSPTPTPEPTVDPKGRLLQKLQKDLETELGRGNWEEANSITSKMLAIDPENKNAKSKLLGIKQKLYSQAIERAKERESKNDFAGAIDAYRTAQTYRNDPTIPEKINALRRGMADQKIKKSEALYVEALQVSQEGRIEEAINLCKQSLALNPDNFQAQRMLDRLLAKSTK